MGILNAQGEIIFLNTWSSDQVRQAQDLIRLLTEEFLRLAQDPALPGSAIAGAALGIPGLVDPEQGIVYQSPHFPLWQNIPLGSELKSRLPFPCFIENDANKAALGEAAFGAGKDWRDFIMLTLGTGIGGGIIVGGKIFHGPLGFAGEVGHMVIDMHGLAGALGSRGTLESFASLSGLRLHLAEAQKASPADSAILALNTDSARLPEELAQLAKAGNKTAQGLWEVFGEALACGIASLSHSFGIFRFVIGGGLSGAWELFMKPCLREIPNRVYPFTSKLIQIVPATLGNEAGLMGGLPMILHQTK
jgi:glucokinase